MLIPYLLSSSYSTTLSVYTLPITMLLRFPVRRDRHGISPALYLRPFAEYISVPSARRSVRSADHCPLLNSMLLFFRFFLSPPSALYSRSSNVLICAFYLSR